MGLLMSCKKFSSGRPISDEAEIMIRQKCPLDRRARIRRGVWTIGFNHKHQVSSTTECTPEGALALLRYDLGVICAGVCMLVKVPLLQHQFDALVSFAHDMGLAALRDSTMLAVLNSGNYTDIPEELSLWHVGDDRTPHCPIRTARRHAEAQLWMGIYH